MKQRKQRQTGLRPYFIYGKVGETYFIEKEDKWVTAYLNSLRKSKSISEEFKIKTTTVAYFPTANPMGAELNQLTKIEIINANEMEG